MAKKTITETPAVEEVSKTIEETIQESLAKNCINLLTEVKNGNNDVLNKDHIFDVTFNDYIDNYKLSVGSIENNKGIIYLAENLQGLPASIVGFSIMYFLQSIDETISHIQNNQTICFVVQTPESIDQNPEVSPE